jgi:hypothetical protein
VVFALRVLKLGDVGRVRESCSDLIFSSIMLSDLLGDAISRTRAHGSYYYIALWVRLSSLSPDSIC